MLITLLPLWSLLPSANCQGEQNGCSSCKLDNAKCSFAGTLRHTGAVERADCGPRIPMIRVLEPGLALPAFSILLFAEVAIAAIVAGSIHVRRNSDNLTVWDIAGAFTMMGCAATIFSEPDQAAQFFEQPVEQHPDAPL